MHEYRMLKHILLKNAESYTDNLLFQFAQKGEKVISISYRRFLFDLTNSTIAAQKIPASRIAIIGYNSYEWIITMFSLMLAGKKMVLLNPDISDQELQHLLEYTDVEHIMLSDELIGELSYLHGKYQIGAFFKSTTNDINSLDVMAYFSKLPEFHSSFLCFSSGTTQSSKGVVTTSETLLQHIMHVRNDKCYPCHLGECCFLPLPLYHMFGLTFLFHNMEVGATIGFSSSPRYLAKEARLLNPHVAVLVPSMFEALLTEETLMPRIHTVITGGSSSSDNQLALVKNKGAVLMNVYGSTESSGFIFYNEPNGDEKWLKPLDGVQYGLNEEGELWMAPPYHMEGYYKRPEDTARALKGDVLWTGDLAVINPDGYIKIHGRLRDTIVMENGEKIHAEDMDQMLLSMTYVKDAAIVYSTDFGMVAVIVPESKECDKAIQAQIETHNKTIGPQFRIHHVWIRHENLPRTSTGKLRRHQLEIECRHQVIAEGN